VSFALCSKTKQKMKKISPRKKIQKSLLVEISQSKTSQLNTHPESIMKLLEKPLLDSYKLSIKNLFGFLSLQILDFALHRS